MKERFAEHVATRRRTTDAALEATGYDALVLSSGHPFLYYADDMHAPHHSTPHFAHWAPLTGPHHLLHVVRGERPKLVRVAPEDYWYEQAPLGEPFWASQFDIVEVGDEERAWKEVAPGAKTAFVGDDSSQANVHGIEAGACNPDELIARLDWERSYKSDYEVECIEESSRQAARGHHAAREAFEAGASEIAIHHAYVTAAGCTDRDLPYNSIVALNEKGAILHYENKRDVGDGDVLLIDCGATHLGYASDITRTWTRERCDADFRSMVEGLDRAQLELCEAVRPGLPYGDLHHMAHVKIADLLCEIGVLARGGEAAVEDGLTRPFFPHGLGHFLGLQTHDVAGHQKEPTGGRMPPPEQHPFLRTTRTIEAGQVFTIEPGIYFIEMLLRPYRDGRHSADFRWDQIDRMTPYGGVRIEDNVVVTSDGHRNLTRPYV